MAGRVRWSGRSQCSHGFGGFSVAMVSVDRQGALLSPFPVFASSRMGHSGQGGLTVRPSDRQTAGVLTSAGGGKENAVPQAGNTGFFLCGWQRCGKGDRWKSSKKEKGPLVLLP